MVFEEKIGAGYIRKNDWFVNIEKTMHRETLFEKLQVRVAQIF